MFGLTFPWRIFWRTFLHQVIGFIFILLSALFFAYWFLPVSDDLTLQKQFQEQLGAWLKSFIPLTLLYVVLMSIFLAYRFVLPLTSVISRTRALVTKGGKKDAEVLDDSAYEEEIGEYFELEQLLRRIRRKIKKKRDQVFSLREEHEALLLALTDAVVVVNSQQQLTSFNSSFATQFMTKEQTIEQTSMLQVLREPLVLKMFTEVIARGQNQKVEVRLSNNLSNLMHEFSVKVSPLRKKKTGEIYGALGVFQDITDLKRAEKIRIDFVGNASHELRTPLTTVKGYLDTLREDLAEGNRENVVPFTEIIHKNVDRLVNLVNDLLLISKLEAHGDLFLDEIDPEQATMQVVDALSSQIKEKGHLVKVNSSIKLLVADAVKVEQVLTNLISNAVKYTPSGGTLQISWYQDEKGQSLLSVKDNGPGISQEHIGRLFERFYRVDKGRSRESGGTGLGLSIVKHIMQSHSGQVIVESEVGRGSEFICLFPKRV